MKKFYSVYQHPQDWRFAIEEGGAAGFYMYVYKYPDFFEDDMRDGEYGCPRHQDDYLQDTLEYAKEEAYELFGVPMDSWVESKGIIEK